MRNIEWMDQSLRKFAMIVAVVSVIGTGLLVMAWHMMQTSLSMHSTLMNNIGEIHRIDEILTNSAKLAALTGNPAQARRYRAHAPILDDLLEASLALFPSERADNRLAETEQANYWLMETEKRALALSAFGPSAKAFALLETPEYEARKAAYASGVKGALATLNGRADTALDRQYAAVLSIGAIIIVAIMAVGFQFIWRREAKTALAYREGQVEAMQAAIGSTMDLHNNLLNNMVYFRTKADMGTPFDSSDIEIIDREIDTARHRMVDIAALNAFETRDLGGIPVLASNAGASQIPSVRRVKTASGT